MDYIYININKISRRGSVTFWYTTAVAFKVFAMNSFDSDSELYKRIGNIKSARENNSAYYETMLKMISPLSLKKGLGKMRLDNELLSATRELCEKNTLALELATGLRG